MVITDTRGGEPTRRGGNLSRWGGNLTRRGGFLSGPFSKRWWNKKVAEARKIWAREKKLWGKVTPNRERLKQAQNAFYRTIRRAKRESWQKFLLGEEELNVLNVTKIYSRPRRLLVTIGRGEVST